MFAFIYGVIAQMAFAPTSIWIFLPIALALIIRQTHKKSFNARAVDGFIFSLGFTLPLLHWSSTFVGIWPWLILAIGAALLIAPFTWFTNQRGWKLLLLLPAFWVVLEWVRVNYPFGGFGWGRAGFIAVDTPFSQLLSIGGVPLASFTVVFLGILLHLTFLQMKFQFAPLLLIVFANILIPTHSLNANDANDLLKVAAVQGSVPDLGLDFNSQREAVLNNHLKLTQNWKAQPNRPTDFNPELFVWPENASDVDPLTVAKNQISNLVNYLDKPLIVGGVGSKNSRPTNLSILWEAEIGPKTIYLKQHLAPFGEVMPLRSLAEFVSPLAKNVTDFQAGEKSMIFQVGDAKILPVICFEILDDRLLKHSTGNSNLLLAQTNNATFGESAESDQQLQITRARAVEYGRSIVVVSTVGNTALIDQNGKIISILPKYDPGILYGEVNLSSSNTYAHWLTAWVEKGCFAVIVIFLLSILKRRYLRVP